MENGNTESGGGEPAVLNGTSEKHHSSSHKSDHKDKHRDKDKDRHRSDKDKHRHSSSKSSHRDKEHSSHKDKDRDKEKEGEKSHKSSSHSSSSKDNKDRHKDKHSSSSSKDKDRHKDGSSKDKHSSSSSSKDKDKHKEHSSNKDKDRSRDKDKERHRDKDKSHRDKDHHSSSHKDKDRHKSSHSSSKSSDKERRRDDEKSELEVPIVKIEIKNEPEPAEESAEESNLVVDQALDESQDPLDTSQEESAIKDEAEDDEDETPLTMRDGGKRSIDDEESEEDIPLTARAKKIKREPSKKKRKRAESSDDDEEEDYKPKKKPAKKAAAKPEPSPRKGKAKQEEEEEVWKWWEEKKRDDGTKWKFLEHKGPLFAPAYEPLPSHVKFYYDGKEMRLSQDAEEVATFYAKMLNHDYTAKEVFNTNFMKDWRKVMSEKERAIIRDLSKCNFKKMHEYFTEKSEERKARSKEEKQREKEENAAIQKEYGICIIDGHKEKIGNFRIEPPGLFRGRGEHPKMGMLKKRITPEEVQINCSKDSKIPQPPPGHKWKKVIHDNQVTWLASWIENVQGNGKYVMLNPSSKLKGEKDMLKYEMARKLAKKIKHIRETYIADWKSKEMRIRQRAVALYFIDRLALRAGNEKDEDQADTVGCCSLRVEHVSLKDHFNGKDSVVIFDFLGKDSIRYYNEVPVEHRVYKNLKLFMENKKPGDDLFDRLNTSVLNKHLSELMEGLTAKVFRTYNASITLQNQLNELTNEDDTIPEKILAYNRANRAVAILCNHQRAAPKSFDKSMESLQAKISSKQEDIEETKSEVKRAKKNHDSSALEKANKKLARLKEQMMKLTIQETDRQENKTIALGTSKLNYLDPRISVAWCKKHDVPIEKIYNKTQRDKFRWAIDMAGPDYVF